MSIANTNHAHFFDFCHHHNNGTVMFPQHSPEVLGRLHHGALSSNVCLATSIALHQRHIQQALNYSHHKHCRPITNFSLPYAQQVL